MKPTVKMQIKSLKDEILDLLLFTKLFLILGVLKNYFFHVFTINMGHKIFSVFKQVKLQLYSKVNYFFYERL